MKIDKTRRFNLEKKGSFEVETWLTDWECSITIGALKHYLKKKGLPKQTKTFVRKYLYGEKIGFSQALGKVLKSEFDDLKQ